jgi:hypothetical protein
MIIIILRLAILVVMIKCNLILSVFFAHLILLNCRNITEIKLWLAGLVFNYIFWLLFIIFIQYLLRLFFLLIHTWLRSLFIQLNLFKVINNFSFCFIFNFRCVITRTAINIVIINYLLLIFFFNLRQLRLINLGRWINICMLILGL